MTETSPTEPGPSSWWQQGAGRALAIALGSLYLLGCLVPLFYGILAIEVRCGDACGQDSGWLEDAGAWQWTPLAFLGIAVFAAAATLLVAVVVRAGRLGGRALLASGVCWIALGTLALTGA